MIDYNKIMICTYPVSKEILVVSSKTFVQPEHVPPVASDEVTEPHVSDFVGENVSDDVLEVTVSVFFIVQQIGFSENERPDLNVTRVA